MKIYIPLILMVCGELHAASVAETNFQLRERDDQTTYEDVKPILEKHCVRCHSGDRPRANLALAAFPFSKNGASDESLQAGIVSRLIARSLSDTRPMPPRNSPFEPLVQEQVDTLQNWLDEGLLTKPESLFVIQTSFINEEGEVVGESETVFERNPFLERQSLQLQWPE